MNTAENISFNPQCTICVCVYMCIYIYIYVYIYTYLCMCMCMHIYIYIYMCVCIYIYIYIYICVYIYIYTCFSLNKNNIYIHTYTHMFAYNAIHIILGSIIVSTIRDEGCRAADGQEYERLLRAAEHGIQKSRQRGHLLDARVWCPSSNSRSQMRLMTISLLCLSYDSVCLC